MNNAAKYTLVAVNDENDTCQCCGRTGLKKTAVLVNDFGDTKILGTTCAGKYLGKGGGESVKAIDAVFSRSNHLFFAGVKSELERGKPVATVTRAAALSLKYLEKYGVDPAKVAAQIVDSLK